MNIPSPLPVVTVATLNAHSNESFAVGLMLMDEEQAALARLVRGVAKKMAMAYGLGDQSTAMFCAGAELAWRMLRAQALADRSGAAV